MITINYLIIFTYPFYFLSNIIYLVTVLKLVDNKLVIINCLLNLV